MFYFFQSARMRRKRRVERENTIRRSTALFLKIKRCVDSDLTQFVPHLQYFFVLKIICD